MQRAPQNKTIFGPGVVVVHAFVRNALRMPRFWALMLSYLGCLLWWRYALPWPHEFPGHTHGANVAWAFDSSWPCYAAYVWLLWRLLPTRRENPDHPLSQAAFQRIGFGSWSALRALVEAWTCLLAAGFLQWLVAGSLGAGFHVEPGVALANALFVAGASGALLWIERFCGVSWLRVVLAVVLLGFPEFLRHGHAAHEGVVQLSVASALIIGGFLVLSDTLWRTDALRHSG